jgi:hypothetical protein
LLGPCLALASGLAIPCASSLTVACSACNPTGREPIVYSAGRTVGALYESGGVNEEMLHFPSGRTYDFEHGLGVCPSQITPYISFVAEPFSDESRGQLSNVALAAGNEALIEDCNERTFRVRNDTCAEFYLRVVALSASPGLGGAGPLD